ARRSRGPRIACDLLPPASSRPWEARVVRSIPNGPTGAGPSAVHTNGGSHAESSAVHPEGREAGGRRRRRGIVGSDRLRPGGGSGRQAAQGAAVGSFRSRLRQVV